MTDPVKNLRALGLKRRDLAVDLGAGSGFYTLPLASFLTEGKVYAVEVQKDFLHTIEKKAHEHHVENIEYIWGDVEVKGGTHLKDNLADLAIASNILFQVGDKEGLVTEAYRVLKPGGRILLIDWESGVSPVLTSGHRAVSKEEARNLFEKHGFSFVNEISPGDHHYGIIFSKR